jgi:aspartate aminotransferase
MQRELISVSKIVGRRCLELSAMGSEIRKMFLIGQEQMRKNPSLDLIDLSLGNPDLEPPPEVNQAIQQLLLSEEPGTHRYMDNAGFPHVRKFLAEQFSLSEGTPIVPDSVFLTCGAAGGLQIVLRTLIDEGDEVIIFAPYFSEYIPYTSNVGAIPIVVKSDENHIPILAHLKESLTEKTKMVIVNSPNNPSGVVYPKLFFTALVDLLEEHRKKTGKVVHIVSDEPYSRLMFPQSESVSLLALYDAAWVIRSHSKDLGLAGERIGYVAWGSALAQPEVLAAMRNSARALGFVNAPALMQRLLPLVYHSKVDVSIYQKRVQMFREAMLEAGLECAMPGAGFFIFPKSPIADDREFCHRLIEAGVLTVPGSGFGSPGYFRASLTQSFDNVKRAAARIASVVKEFK